MKKLSLYTLYAFIGLSLLSILTKSVDKKLIQNTQTATTTTEIQTPKDPIQEQLDRMSTDEKIGSLLILGFRGPTINEHIQTLITKYHVGGVNLLKWNIESKEQMKKLSSDLQNLYKKDHNNLSFIVAADQEGGTVVRFKFLNEKTAQPNIKTIGQAIEVTKTRAKELQELGVNMNFAPVADFITNTKSYLYNRTFATTSDGTIELAKTVAEVYLAQGIMPVYKHFPGYGNSTIDPHKSITIFDGTKEMFDENIRVFKNLLQKEKNVPVMTAHIQVPWISSKPATKEKYFMTDVLRDDFDFQGVVITDDLDMASIGKDQGINAVESINAGADMLISTPNDANHIVVLEALKKAVEDGTITKERLDQAAYRVLVLRNKLAEIQE